MQEPALLVAVDPGERRVGHLRDEIVAARLVAVPPSRLDALGAGEQDESAFFRFLSFFEQPNRARSGLMEVVRIPLARLDAPPGMLGAVLGMRGEAAHRLVPKARAQPLEQARPALGFGAGVAEHGAAARVQRLEIRRLQPDRLHRPRERRGGELLAQQLREALGLARGGGEGYMNL